MKHNKVIVALMFFYLVITVESIITVSGNNLNTNQQYIVNKDSKPLDIDGYFNNVGGEVDKNPVLINSEEQITLGEALNSFNPDLNITGDYAGEYIEGSIEESNTSISLPGKGEYSLEGNVTNLEAQYIQNPGAEESSQFYADDVINVGLGVERIADMNSFSGNYVWKYHSYNTESITYALYQKDLPLYYTDTKISYSYYLSSDSSLQNIINSSLIFDFVFDTCRVMVTHWHYTNIEPPSIGDNTTTPFIVYRLLQNSSWNDQWNQYSLSISDLFTEGDPFIPTMVKSFGIYVISPEESDCTVLIDDFVIESSVEPTDINLTVNNLPIVSVSPGTGSINSPIIFNLDEPYIYDTIWNHVSNYAIRGNFTIRASGLLQLTYEKQVTFYNETMILYTIDIPNLSSLISEINVTYPDIWTLFGSPSGANILSSNNLGNGFEMLILERQEVIYSIECDFALQNYISEVNYEQTTIFETLNASFEFEQTTIDPNFFILWNTGEEGGSTCDLINNSISYSFPPSLVDGYIDITFLIIENNYLGYATNTINLLRKPAAMIVEDQIEIPKYSLKELSVSYISLDQYVQIENAVITAKLDGDILQSVQQGEEYIIYISSFYLSQQEYVLEILAESQTHSTIRKLVSVNISESEILIDFQYELSDNPAEYILNFNITSGGLPVGYAPITIEVNQASPHTGITEINGHYSYTVELPLDILTVNITCTIFKVSKILATETFLIEFENSLVSGNRSLEDVIISKNITLSYDLHYSIDHDRWTYLIDDEMVPILDAYVETPLLRIPVTWDSNSLYWQIPANSETEDHKLVITTYGPNMQITSETGEDRIMVHFVISSETKGYTDLTVMYHMNESYTTSKYNWKLIVNNQSDVTEYYNLEVNDLYAYFTNLDILRGSILIFDLVGNKNSQSNIFTGIVIPAASSTSVLLGAITVGLKIYNKRKGMILEI